MKHIITSCLIAINAMTAYAQHTPVYLDETQPMELRIDDALSRMTLQEKIRVIHAQSKFS
jgi:beta-glucosidase